jgi:hypothetical protein
MIQSIRHKGFEILLSDPDLRNRALLEIHGHRIKRDFDAEETRVLLAECNVELDADVDRRNRERSSGARPSSSALPSSVGTARQRDERRGIRRKTTMLVA